MKNRINILNTYEKAKAVKLRPCGATTWYAFGWDRTAKLTKTGRGRFTVTIAGETTELELSEKDAKQWVRDTLARLEFN